MEYLNGAREGSNDIIHQAPTNTDSARHSRIPSIMSDNSTSTVTGPTASSVTGPKPPISPTSPLDDYSANLANFIKTQLKSIPTYHPMVIPRSCPDLISQSRTPPLSPTVLQRRPTDIPHILEMPPVRPPLRSAFSAWSSTDEEAESDVPPLPGTQILKENTKTSAYTPSILGYYEDNGDASFLFSSTPLEEGETQHPNAKGFSFPNRPAPPASTSETHSPHSHDYGYPSSALSTHPQLTSSSAPSFSSTSTGSYFDCKRPLSITPHLRDRIIAAVSPHHGKGNVLTAISPFEGGALSNVHDVYIESQKRVLVDGLSFDLIRDFTMPDEGMRAMPRVPTPC